ncbi:MAG TPA: phosphotransferase [Kofleriaceae bacterium]|nr:phosphotransferase [Kofleriaceae bacterium]
MTLPAGLRARLGELFPGTHVVRAIPLRDDETGGPEMKALGYGRPLRIQLSDGRTVVFHVLRPDDFGHDRRADRVGNLVLAYDTFAQVPHHAHALDVGLVRDDGLLVSLANTGEPYLVTSWVDGTLYADELRHVHQHGASPVDVAHAEALARVLLEIHAQPGSHPGAYTRAIRDLLGHGEGIFGLVDSYEGDVVPPARLRALEEACLAWRWKLRDQTHRLRRTHGDFHPFNIVLASDRVHLLDASRGSEGDPADDVACLAINFVFFGEPARPLWDAFWRTYLAGDGGDVRAAVAPFFAWRALVLASPKWYPHLAPGERERILAFAEGALAAPRFDHEAGWPP